MPISPNEHYMVAKERANDAMREAEAWRQHQALRRQGRTLSHTSGVALGLKRLVRRLSAVPADEVGRERGPTVSSPAR